MKNHISAVYAMGWKVHWCVFPRFRASRTDIQLGNGDAFKEYVQPQAKLLGAPRDPQEHITCMMLVGPSPPFGQIHILGYPTSIYGHASPYT